MRWTRKFLGGAIGLALTAQVASAQVTVNYTTTGSFTGLCTGIVCTLGGMTIAFNPLTSNSVTLDANNGYFSFLSFGEFNVSGTTVGQQSFAGVNFALNFTQNQPTPVGAQTLTGTFAGGIDNNSSNLRWTPTPASWSLPWGPTGTINYATTGQTNLQAPTSNGGVTTIQGQVSTNVVPEPSTYLLMSGGLAGVLLFARKRRAS